MFSFSYAKDQQLPHIIIYFAMFVVSAQLTVSESSHLEPRHPADLGSKYHCVRFGNYNLYGTKRTSACPLFPGFIAHYVTQLRPSETRFITTGSKSILVKLTRFTIETGLVTTVATLVELILRYTSRTWMSYIAVFYVTSKLYSNCLLASLNHRLILRNKSDQNMTAIVWDSDDVASDMQSGQPGDQPSQVIQTLAQTESHTDTVRVSLHQAQVPAIH
ncbi:hypothetical protein J3R82DRAFT_6431 [Butyriboletus roseoflavus]|nr:hypothetical protein J3R82DRAFT_6431 [Butyriboletus roseoflavus]